MVAITGATGFLGRHLVRSLKSSGIPFRCLVRDNSKSISRLNCTADQIRFVDFFNPDSIRTALRGCDAVIHMLGVINADQSTLQNVNIEIAKRVAWGAVKEGCKKFIHISSVAASMRHGPYGESKYAGEQAVKEAGIPYTILRPAFIYGEGDENNTKMLIHTLRRWPVVPLLGGGTFKLQPVFVADVVSVILKAIEIPPQNTEFNVAGPAQISLKEMLQILSRSLKRNRYFFPIPLRPVQFLMRIFLFFFPDTKLPAKQILELDKHLAFDIERTQMVFGFNPVPFESGVKKMFQDDLCAG